MLVLFTLFTAAGWFAAGVGVGRHMIGRSEDAEHWIRKAWRLCTSRGFESFEEFRDAMKEGE